MADIQVQTNSVLVKPGEEGLAAEAPALGPYTKQGSTANFDVYYDNSL